MIINTIVFTVIVAYSGITKSQFIGPGIPATGSKYNNSRKSFLLC